MRNRIIFPWQKGYFDLNHFYRLYQCLQKPVFSEFSTHLSTFSNYILEWTFEQFHIQLEVKVGSFSLKLNILITHEIASNGESIISDTADWCAKSMNRRQIPSSLSYVENFTIVKRKFYCNWFSPHQYFVCVIRLSPLSTTKTWPPVFSFVMCFR